MANIRRPNSQDRFSLKLQTLCLDCHAGRCAVHQHHQSGLASEEIDSREYRRRAVCAIINTSRLPSELQLKIAVCIYPLTFASLTNTQPFKDLYQKHRLQIVDAQLMNQLINEQDVFPLIVERTLCPSGRLFNFVPHFSCGPYWLFMNRVAYGTKMVADYLVGSLGVGPNNAELVCSTVLHLWRFFGDVPNCPPAGRIANQEAFVYLASLSRRTRMSILAGIQYLGKRYLATHPFVWQDGVPEKLREELQNTLAFEKCGAYLMMGYLRYGMRNVFDKMANAIPLDLPAQFARLPAWTKPSDRPYRGRRRVMMVDYWTYSIRCLGSRGSGILELSCPHAIDIFRAPVEACDCEDGEIFNWDNYFRARLMAPTSWSQPRQAYWHWALWEADELLGIAELFEDE